MEYLTWEQFEKCDIRVGTIVEAVVAEGTLKPAIRLVIDFGNLGVKKSSAQITQVYQPEALVGKQVLAVVNFPPKQIGKFISECLVLGVTGDERGVILIQPDRNVPEGLRIA